jgi:TRAP-type transport system periplasmic protein
MRTGKAFTLAVAAAVSAAASAASGVELKLADFQSPTAFVVDSVYEPLAESVAEGTDGEVTLRVYMGGELGPGPAEQYSRVVDGVADIALSLPGYTASTFPKTLLTEFPGVISPETGTEQILENLDMLSDEYRRVVLLALWNNAPNLLFTADTPIRSMEDLQGLNIRVPSRNAGLVVQAWGANPVSMPGPEIYNAMQTGVIDGAMIDASTLEAFRLKEVTNYITMGMDTTMSTIFLIMNRDSFSDLSDDQQQVVLDAGREAAVNGHAAWMQVSEQALADFEATEGKEVISLSSEEAEKFNQASSGVLEQVIAELETEGVEAGAFVDALRSE